VRCSTYNTKCHLTKRIKKRLQAWSGRHVVRERETGLTSETLFNERGRHVWQKGIIAWRLTEALFKERGGHVWQRERLVWRLIETLFMERETHVRRREICLTSNRNPLKRVRETRMKERGFSEV